MIPILGKIILLQDVMIIDAKKFPHDLFHRYPILRVAVAMVFGIVAGECFYAFFEQYMGVLFVMVVVFVALLSLLLFAKHFVARFSRIASTMVNLVFVFLGILLLVSHRIGKQVDWGDEQQSFCAMVVDVPKETEKTFRAEVALLDGENKGRHVRLSLLKGVYDTLQVGEVVACTAVVETPKNIGNPGDFDYAKWLLRRGVTGVAFCPSEHWTKSDTLSTLLPLKVRALQLRERMVAEYEQYFEGKDLGVLSAMTLGDKSGIDAELRQMYAQGGVSHVLALSGLHVGLLFGLFRLFILGRIHRRSTYLLVASVGVLLIWVYAFLAGLPLSLVRAVTMFTLMQALQCLRRDSLSVNNLAIAALLILIASPHALFDVGFQLSFLSVLSIMLFMPCLSYPQCIRGSSVWIFVYELLATSFFAQLATLPLVLYYFHVLPVYSLLVNVFVVSLTMVLLGVAACFWLLPFLRWLIAYVIDVLLMLIDGVLQFFMDLPCSSLLFYPNETDTLLLYLVFMGTMLLFIAKRRIRVVLFLLCVAMGWAIYHVVYLRQHDSTKLVFYRLQSGFGVHAIVAADSSYLLTDHPAPLDNTFGYIRRNYWQPHRMSQPLLLDTCYSGPHIAYRDGMLKFSGKRVAVLDTSLQQAVPTTPFKVDYLLITKGYRGSVEELSQFFTPSLLVLNADLPSYRRCIYKEQSELLSWQVYDIDSEGALVVPF